MSAGDYLELAFLNHLIRGVAYTPPSLYVSLHTGDPGETGASECAGLSYTRKAVAASAFPAAASGQVANSNTRVTFAQCPDTSWGTITHAGLWDALSGGNFLVGDALTSSIVTRALLIVYFDLGQLIVRTA